MCSIIQIAFRPWAPALILLVSALSAQAYVPGDQNWDTQFGAPGTTNFIDAIAVNGGNLYVSGFYNRTCTLRVWNGLQWSTIGTFTNTTGGPTIYDMAFVGNTLYAAGQFSAVNGVAAAGLAAWNGSSWTGILLGTPVFASPVKALAVSGTDLFAGGSFTNLDASNVMMTNIGMWDGSAWHALGPGLGMPLYQVQSVAVNGGLVYAGGIFTNAGSQSVSGLAVWNGTNWGPVGGAFNGAVSSIAFGGGNMYVAGGFTQAGSTAANYVAAWNGTTWSALGAGLNAAASSIAVFNNLVCVSGVFATAGSVPVSNFAVWNGASWSAAGTGLDSSGNRLVATATNLFVGGDFGGANGTYVSHITSWDGTNWSPIGIPGRMNGVVNSVNALATDGTNLYAGGTLTYAGLSSVTNLARFDGTNWYSLGIIDAYPTNAVAVDAIAISSNGVYVGGDFSSVSGVSAANIAQWDGTNWHPLAGGPQGGNGIVASITARPDGLYVTGASYNGTVYGEPFLFRWDGTNWNNVVNYNPSNTFVQFTINDPLIGMDAVAFQGSNLFLGGHFDIEWHDPTLTIFSNCPNILMFDGTYAQIVGTGLDSNVLSLAAVGNNVYAAGNFAHAGGNAANKIARWDGTNWYAVGSGVVGNGNVQALAAMGNYLYAGGNFTNMGGVATPSLARWDGTNWTALGSGAVGGVQCLAVLNSDLYVGGTMRSAGVNDSFAIAHWNSQSNFDVPQLILPLWIRPNQFDARLFGVAGLTNVVQASADLKLWTAIATNTNGVYEFADTNASGFPARYYRAVLAP